MYKHKDKPFTEALRIILVINCQAQFQLAIELNTPGTAGGPGGRERTLAIKSRKNARKSGIFRNKIKITIFCCCIYLLFYAKILGETNFCTRASYACELHLGWRTQAAWAKKQWKLIQCIKVMLSQVIFVTTSYAWRPRGA